MISAMRRLSILGGQAIMDVYQREDMGVRVKDDASPVTEADEAADKVISAGLRAEFPDIPLITEEQSATHNLDVKTFLIVDPLDGTKEFVKRRGDFTVNIAMVEDGVPTLGVVYAPAKGRLFLTRVDGGVTEETGAFDPDVEGPTKPVGVTTPDMSALRVVASKSHRDQATDDYINKYEVADSVSAGSSLKFCLVATGEADFYPRLGPTMEWDTAAGHAICNAVGLEVYSLETHKPLQYNKENLLNPWFLVRKIG